MNKKVLYLALGVALMGTTSCNKKLGDFQSNYFNTTPTPLETVGMNVPATITGNIPAKFMRKNAKVTATPVLEYAGGSAQGTPVVLQGENVRANGQVVSYNNGGSVQIPFNTEYQPGMAQSNLYLDFQVDQNGKLYSLPRVKVGEGVIATSTLANAGTVDAAIAKDNFQRIINEKYSADIRFLINQAIIRNNQISAADYVDLNQQLRDANAAVNKEIAGVTIHSYASPDGTLAFNTELAERREKVTEKFMANQLKKDKITEFGELTATFTPEDWEGFQELVSKSNIQDKDLILGVLKMYKDPEQRETEIRNLSGVFNELADQILPQLRYSKIMASINVIGKSDEEIVALFNSNPSALSEDEILYAATLTDDWNRKKEVYAKAGQIYPNSARAMNNLGMAEYALGNYAAAQSAFEKAKRLDPSLKSTDMNLGLIQILNGNYSKANELLGSAAGVPEAADALGVYYLTQGEVAKANTAFGNSKTNNAALAKLLAKDYSSAQSILSAVPNPDANTYYIAALVSARTNNENGVINNLRKAISMDSSLLQKAKADLEFANFNLNSL